MARWHHQLTLARKCLRQSIKKQHEHINTMRLINYSTQSIIQSNESVKTPSIINQTIAMIGLGNPGNEYDGTRHNIGFDMIDRYAKLNNILVNQSSNQSLIGKGMINNRNLILAKPQTYMNLSGRAVASISHLINQSKHQNIDRSSNQPHDQPAKNVVHPSNMIVLFDDLSLPVGTIRLSIGGGSGGHNGIESIIQSIGPKSFVRVRVGIANEHYNLSEQRANTFDQSKADFVLGKFNLNDQRSISQSSWPRVAEALKCIVEGSVDRAMNAVNGKARFG